MQESDFQIDTCAAWVMACLTSSDPDEALVALSGDPQPLAGVVGEENRPLPLVGLVTAMMAGALIRSGRPAEVEAIYERIADLFAPQRRVYVRGSNFSDLVGAFPYLHLSAIRAFLTLGDQASAFSVVLWIDKVLRRSPRWDIPEDPVLKPLLSHPAMEAYGPFSIERNWLLDRQDEILANFKPDRYLESTYDFDECLVLNALLTEQPGRALPVLERRGLLGSQASIELANSGHLEFNAVCVLATLGRFDAALALARAMVQQGYCLVFSERPSIETHLALADYGDRHARWRKGLVSAMRAYALHLYSNVHPGADWFLEGLEHFSRARCSQLLFFLIHHPEDDDVLATMIEQEWLPSGVGTGGYDAYENARAFYYRAAILNRMLHAPDRLDFWLSMPWVLYYSKMAKDRETRQLVERWRKRKAR